MKEQSEQRKLSEITQPMNEELFNNLEKQYEELAKVKAESDQNEKQAIEEMAKDLDFCPYIAEPIGCNKHDGSTRIALYLYNAGYRKRSEGEWVEHPHFNFEGGYSGANYECSNCHYDDCYEEEPYCPKCGAKMKGESK